jgi:hypothetical protein
LCYPVVSKRAAEVVAHKSELGLVHIGLCEPASITRVDVAVGSPQLIFNFLLPGAVAPLCP